MAEIMEMEIRYDEQGVAWVKYELISKQLEMLKKANQRVGEELDMDGVTKSLKATIENLVKELNDLSDENLKLQAKLMGVDDIIDNEGD